MQIRSWRLWKLLKNCKKLNTAEIKWRQIQQLCGLFLASSFQWTTSAYERKFPNEPPRWSSLESQSCRPMSVAHPVCSQYVFGWLSEGVLVKNAKLGSGTCHRIQKMALPCTMRLNTQIIESRMSWTTATLVALWCCMMLNANASMHCLHVLTFANYHLTGSAAEADLNVTNPNKNFHPDMIVLELRDQQSHWVSWGSQMSVQNVTVVRLYHLWLRYLSLEQAHWEIDPRTLLHIQTRRTHRSLGSLIRTLFRKM